MSNLRIIKQEELNSAIYKQDNIYCIFELNGQKQIINFKDVILLAEQNENAEPKHVDSFPYYMPISTITKQSEVTETPKVITRDKKKDSIQPVKNSEIKQNNKSEIHKKVDPKKKLDLGKMNALRNAGWTYAAIADEMNVSPKTVGRYLKMIESGQIDIHDVYSIDDAETEN